MPKSKGPRKPHRNRHQHTWGATHHGTQRCLSCPETRDVGVRLPRPHHGYGGGHMEGHAIDLPPGVEVFHNRGPLMMEWPER